MRAGVDTINSKRRSGVALAVHQECVGCWYHHRILSALLQINIYRWIPIMLVYDKVAPPVFGPTFLVLLHTKRAFFTVADGR